MAGQSIFTTYFGVIYLQTMVNEMYRLEMRSILYFLKTWAQAQASLHVFSLSCLDLAVPYQMYFFLKNGDQATMTF